MGLRAQRGFIVPDMPGEAGGQRPALGMLVHPGGHLAQADERLRQPLFGRLAAGHEFEHHGMARIGQVRTAQELDHAAVRGRNRFRRLDAGVPPQRRHPLQLGVYRLLAVIADAMDAQDRGPAGRRVVDAIGGVFRKVDQFRGGGRRMAPKRQGTLGHGGQARQKLRHRNCRSAHDVKPLRRHSRRFEGAPSAIASPFAVFRS